jgi:hypothetical protein
MRHTVPAVRKFTVQQEKQHQAGGMTEVSACLASRMALILNPSTAKKKEKQNINKCDSFITVV